MSSPISYSNVHQLSNNSDTMNIDMKKKSPSSMKMLLNQQASPDSTNNNNTLHQTPVSSMISTPITFTNTMQQSSSAPRGRGRKTAPTYVQVIPGQPVAVARRNARERNRVKQVNNGFSTLRQHIPFTARNKKMSKVETLRCAVDYIRSLQQLLDENGGYDHGELMNVSSSSPLSSIDSGEESLMSMGTTSDVMYETQTDTVPSSSTILVDEYSPASDYTSQLRTNGVILPTSTKYYHNNNNDVIFSDSPLPQHPNTLIRHGSSLSPGYSDRSSVNNSPAALSSEVTTTHGFMGVFAAAAAGLDKNSTAHGLMMDLSRNGSTNQTLIFKKERDMDEDDERRNNLIELESGNSTDLIMDTLTWWEIEQARRMQQQTQQTSS